MSDVLEFLGNILAGAFFDEKPKQSWKLWLKRSAVIVVATLFVILLWSEYR